MGKIKMEAKIIRQDEIATDIYSMVIQAPEIASQAVPGQFIDLYSADGSKLLPRPISLCEIDRAAGTLRIVYRIAGKGTKEFSMLTSDHTITILGPLGNGFTKKDKKRNPDRRRNRYSTDAAACEGAYLREVDRAWIP